MDFFDDLDYDYYYLQENPDYLQNNKYLLLFSAIYSLILLICLFKM